MESPLRFIAVTTCKPYSARERQVERCRVEWLPKAKADRLAVGFLQCPNVEEAITPNVLRAGGKLLDFGSGEAAGGQRVDFACGVNSFNVNTNIATNRNDARDQPPRV